MYNFKIKFLIKLSFLIIVISATFIPFKFTNAATQTPILPLPTPTTSTDPTPIKSPNVYMNDLIQYFKNGKLDPDFIDPSKTNFDKDIVVYFLSELGEQNITDLYKFKIDLDIQKLNENKPENEKFIFYGITQKTINNIESFYLKKELYTNKNLINGSEEFIDALVKIPSKTKKGELYKKYIDINKLPQINKMGKDAKEQYLNEFQSKINLENSNQIININNQIIDSFGDTISLGRNYFSIDEKLHPIIETAIRELLNKRFINKYEFKKAIMSSITKPFYKYSKYFLSNKTQIEAFVNSLSDNIDNHTLRLTKTEYDAIERYAQAKIKVRWNGSENKIIDYYLTRSVLEPEIIHENGNDTGIQITGANGFLLTELVKEINLDLTAIRHDPLPNLFSLWSTKQFPEFKAEPAYEKTKLLNQLNYVITDRDLNKYENNELPNLSYFNLAISADKKYVIKFRNKYSFTRKLIQPVLFYQIPLKPDFMNTGTNFLSLNGAIGLNIYEATWYTDSVIFPEYSFKFGALLTSPVNYNVPNNLNTQTSNSATKENPTFKQENIPTQLNFYIGIGLGPISIALGRSISSNDYTLFLGATFANALFKTSSFTPKAAPTPAPDVQKLNPDILSPPQ
jgi:hypothetical protein